MRLAPGDRVRVRGFHWRILDTRRFPRCTLLDLAGLEAANRGACARLIVPFDRPVPLGGWVKPRRVHPSDAQRALVALGADGRIRASADARIDILPHQLDPALALLAGEAARVLIADEVGLGKTIQAGLAIGELRARGLADRVLIVTPAGLREQWVDELGGRFHIDATIVDAAALRRQAAAIPRSVNPWTTWPTVVTSVDFVKRADVVGPLADATWDVVVIDEAHGAASESHRHDAADRLARRATFVLLLTATPHNGDDRAFARLCDLGRLTPDETLLVFRRSRREIDASPERHVHLLHIRLTRAEQRMHVALARYVRRVVGEARRRHDGDAMLAMVVLTKRALSGPGSLARSIARRLTLLSRNPAVEGVQMLLPLASDPDREIDGADREPETVLAAAGLDRGAEEHAWLTRLAALAYDAAGLDSKVRAVRALLRRTREPAIVFTEYRDTLATLEAVLAHERPLVLHGGIEARERAAIARAFVAGASRLLLATDVAAEGLNLQAGCRLVINLELPWTPARLEQRIGRVDRIGQTRRVHAFNFVARGTAESDVLARLVRRLHAIRRTIAQVATPIGRVSEEEILLAAIAGRTVRDEAEAPAALGSVRATASDEAAGEAARLARRRALWERLTAHRPRTMTETRERLDAGAPWLTIAKPRPGVPGGLILLFRARAPLDGTPGTEDLFIPLHVEVTRPGRAASTVRALVRAHLGALTARAETEVRRQIEDRDRRRREGLARIAARIDAVEAARAGRGAPAVQPSLFRRRDLIAATADSQTPIACGQTRAARSIEPPALLLVIVQPRG